MKSKKNYRVIVLATSKLTRGGITSVVYAHSLCAFWKKYHVKWIETHIDRNCLWKIWYAIKSFVVFSFVVPQYDLVHIHLSEPSSLLRKLPFFLLCKLYGKKVILHFHSYSPDTTIAGRFHSLYYCVFNLADKVIVLSVSWKKWIKECFDLDENVVVIYNPCIPVPISLEIKENLDRGKFVLYAGTICQRKGYGDLIKAFSMIAYKYPDWKVVFAGNGEIEVGKSLAKKMQISSQVEFVGWVTGKSKENLFSRASIFCLPSYAEGFSVAVLDACAYGIPIVTTRVGGMPDIIQDGVNGMLFEAGDVSYLASLIEKLIVSPNIRNQLAEQSLELAKNVFSLKRIDEEIQRLYQSLLGV